MTTPEEKPSIANRRIFMMGNGKPVLPDWSYEFCDTIINGCMSAEIVGHCEFSLGFAACFDAMARGTIDLEDPIGTVRQAWADVNNITTAPNKVTDIMRIEA